MNAPQPPEVLSFEAVYQQHFEFVWAMTRRFGVAPEAMDDVVQEVFLVVNAKLSTVERPESLRSWLYSIVRRTASGHRRKVNHHRASSPVTVEELPDGEGTPTPADLAEQNEQVRRLWSLLQELDPPKRELFIMAELEEFTCPEIAEALNIPLNTAYSRLRHAREAFEAALARHKARKVVQP